MTKQVQLRRGTAVRTRTCCFTGAIGELTIDTTNEVAVVHDGCETRRLSSRRNHCRQKILNKTAIGIGTTIPQRRFLLMVVM